MNHLKNLTILVLLTIFCSNSYAQNKKPTLRKKVKIEKKKLIKKQYSDTVSKIITPPHTSYIDVKKDNGFKKPKIFFDYDKKI